MRFFLSVLLLLSSLPAAERKPNFVIILVDDMGHAGLGSFGNPYFKTPEIDRLAKEGIRLTDVHSSGTVCSPTRAGLVTGRYQQRAGIEAVIHPSADNAEHRKGLQTSEVTFAELLKEAGYATGIIGKWHLGYPQNSPEYHPQDHGFDEFVGYHSGNIDFVSHIGDHMKHDWWHGREETHEEGYVTDLINRHAVEFVERHADEPFCLYVPHLAIHNPIQVRGDPVRRTETEWNRWKAANPAEAVEKFEGMTLPIDEGVGMIRETLERLALAENTLVMVLSDNGPTPEAPSGNPEWRGLKGSVYEGGHKVPFVAWWPGKITPGIESATPAMTIDLMPTMLSLAGISPGVGKPLDGVDLSGLLLRGEAVSPRPLYWASLGNNGSRAEAMRDGPWKLVVSHPKAAPGSFENESVELYRLDEDTSEESDLADAEPARASSMLNQLKTWYAEVRSSAPAQPGGWAGDPATSSPDVATSDLDWKGFTKQTFDLEEHKAFVVLPKETAEGRPWVWRTSFPDFHAEVDLELLAAGFHVAHVNVVPMLGSDGSLAIMDRFYDLVRNKWGLAAKPALEAVSRGGMHAYRYAATRPGRIACIYADTPVMDLKSWPLKHPKAKGPLADALKYYGFADEKELVAYDEDPLDLLEEIAKARIPLRHVISPNDTVVPAEENTLEAKRQLEALGWKMELLIVDPSTTINEGHHFPLVGIDESVSFIRRHASAE